MSKKVNSSDTINESTLHEILLMMDARLKHIEDIEADNRDIIAKLVKQSNQIVQFLRKIEIEEVPSDFEEFNHPLLTEEEEKKLSKFKHIKEVLDEFISKHKELKEFEEELKKHKTDITPGEIGES